jgi:hypothetical protein
VARNIRKWFYLCLEKTCHNQFSPTSGTLFTDTHLPLIVWFHAIALILKAKKGLSTKQLQRDLGIGGYKTAWYLNHRICKAIEEGALPQLGGSKLTKHTSAGSSVRRSTYGIRREKEVVIGMIERGGRVRFRSRWEGISKGQYGYAPCCGEYLSERGAHYDG